MSVSGLVAAFAFASLAPAALPEPAAVEFFEAKVRPLLVENCVTCHGPKKQQASLRLDTADGLRRGSDGGPVVVPGKPDESKLIQSVRHSGAAKMPPKKKLPAEAIATLEAWVKMGAPWPDAPGTATRPPAEAVAEIRQKHWAFQPVRRPPVPVVKNTAWVQTPVDAFVLAKLEEKGLAPAAPADRRTLLRRVSFDLIGLPPTPAEIDAFEKDTAPDAFAKVVDRLLASPHYGERWGRHWLDVARYADTKGYVFREERRFPFSYTYRDYVIAAFNADKPYDQFILEQLAADQLPLGDDKRPLAALGFLTLGRRFLNNTHDIIDDRIDVTMRGLQGLTVTCARCHDHKFDPIPTKDYYSLYGVFASSVEPKELPVIAMPQQKDAPRAMVLNDLPTPVQPRVLLRGNPGTPGDAVPRQYLLVLTGDQRRPFTQGSGRLELARAIASTDNPLTARVLVNRVWLHHFGKGLVTTPSDFGLRGEPPTHPELLDYLAADFMASGERGAPGWSIKRLHRLILLSSTYQQSSRADAQLAADPDNRWLGRMNRRRLDFEALRDGLLFVAGRLDRTPGGPGVELTAQPFSTRRTVYGFIDRQNLPGLYRTFDFAGPDTSSPQRYTTTVPQQALFLMNSPFVVEQARHLANRPDVTARQEPSRRIEQLYRLCYGRPPDADELALGLRYLETAAKDGKSLTAWEKYAQVLLLANEFAFVD